MRIKTQRIGDHTLPLPRRATDGSAAMDLRAARVSSDWPEIATRGSATMIAPGGTATFHTGFAVAIPDGYVGLCVTRSGNGAKRGVGLRNQVGVIDSDYRGEIMVTLSNRGSRSFKVDPGDRICQMLIVPVAAAECVEVDKLPDTERGADGHGSTGTR